MATQDIFENLVTDITAQVLEQIQSQLQPVVVNAVNQRVDAMVNGGAIAKAIQDRINVAVNQFQPDTSAIDKTIQSLIEQMNESVTASLNNKVNGAVNDRINKLDINGIVARRIDFKLSDQSTVFDFPNNSIEPSAINLANMKITGNNIDGGIITNFASTGVDDQATECKVTILDQGTVFENTLYAPHVVVKGGAVIDGDLDIQGQIVDSPAYRKLVQDIATSTKSVLTDDVLKDHQNLIFDRIQNEGLDLNKVTFNGKILVNGDRLVGVINSSLRTVGTLQDLKTSGETLLSGTLYANESKRVGVNTMDPKTALSVWDEEIEIGIGKVQRGFGRIAVERENGLIIGCNDQDNITMQTDGSTSIPNLRINNIAFGSSQTPPTFSAPRATIIFNENPNLGGPLGWVSLGEARWANFGIID
jgi:hypothetical protein